MKPWIIFTMMSGALLGCKESARVEPAGENQLAVGSRANAVTKLERPGLPNLYRITDKLYRSAQPTAEGMREIEKLGVKTVLSLRAFHSDDDEITSTKLRSEKIRFNTWHAEEEDVLRFLKIVADTNSAPVLVHCLHGADRTGTMIAIYRMAIQGWTKDEAIAEMKSEFGFHPVWRNLEPYLRELDVAALRRKAGLVNTER